MHFFGGRYKKLCISKTIWARNQCQVFLETWERLFSTGLFLKILESMIFPKIALKVEPVSAENSWTLHRVLGQSITVRMMLLHSFSGFQKGLTLRSSSNSSKVISISVKVARLDSIDKYIDKPSHRWRYLLLIETFLYFIFLPNLF